MYELFSRLSRQREIIGIHRDAECIRDGLRQRGNNLFRVAGRAEIDCVYVIDFHENTFSSYVLNLIRQNLIIVGILMDLWWTVNETGVFWLLARMRE